MYLTGIFELDKLIIDQLNIESLLNLCFTNKYWIIAITNLLHEYSVKTFKEIDELLSLGWNLFETQRFNMLKLLCSLNKIELIECNKEYNYLEDFCYTMDKNSKIGYIIYDYIGIKLSINSIGRVDDFYVGPTINKDLYYFVWNNYISLQPTKYNIAEIIHNILHWIFEEWGLDDFDGKFNDQNEVDIFVQAYDNTINVIEQVFEERITEYDEDTKDSIDNTIWKGKFFMQLQLDEHGYNLIKNDDSSTTSDISYESSDEYTTSDDL